MGDTVQTAAAERFAFQPASAEEPLLKQVAEERAKEVLLEQNIPGRDSAEWPINPGAVHENKTTDAASDSGSGGGGKM